jgi:penicillin amidase
MESLKRMDSGRHTPIWEKILLTAIAITMSLTLLSSTGLAKGNQTKKKFISYEVSGLKRHGKILVDKWGIPHMYAKNLHDVFFLQGFNAARDRLWQIDLWRKRGLGLLSEVFGTSFVEKDRASRLFLYRGDMNSEWIAYGSDAQLIAEAFVKGVNAYIKLVRKKPGLLPLEFQLLGYGPDFWNAEDVVRIRSHGLVRNVSSEVTRSQVVRDFGPDVEKIRQKLEPPWEIEVPEGLDLDFPGRF